MPNDDIPISRIEALQPQLSEQDFFEGVIHTEDPLLLHGLTNFVRVWAALHTDLPASFAEHVRVTAAARQPIGWLTLELQEERRNLVDVDEPYAGGLYISEPLTTNDPYLLAPPSPVNFPAEPVSSRITVYGQESVSQCGNCERTGSLTCQACEGKGKVSCSACNGSRYVPCSRCHGAGMHMGVRGGLINCQECRTRGKVPCKLCERGQLICARCEGACKLTCPVCDGHGELKKRWEVETRARTHVHRRVFLPEQWHIPSGFMNDDGDELMCRIWEHPPRDLERQFSQLNLPPKAMGLLREMVDDVIMGANTPDESSVEHISGIRFRLGTAYCYRLTINFEGRTGSLLVAGAGNRVFIESLPTARAGWLGKIIESAQRKLSVLDMADRVGPPEHFVSALRSGSVHITDERCLISRVAALLKAKTVVTGVGYSIDVPIRAARLSCLFEIEIQNDGYQHRVLRTSCRMGLAHRDAAPKAMSINTVLRFGRIALITLEEDGHEYFDFIDVRPYEDIGVVQFAQVLQVMAIDVLRIRRLNTLS